MKPFKTLFSVGLIVACFVGCKNQGNQTGAWLDSFFTANNGIRTNIVANSNNTVALIASLTHVDPKAYNGWNGDCPGTDVDASVFRDMCYSHGVPYVKLENSQATIANVIENAVSVAKSLDSTGGLLVLFFSGHGGQVPTQSQGLEDDGLDETLCLWDGQLRDKDIWSLLNRLPKNVRVWMVTDCCNSGTNYRKPRNFSVAIKRLANERHAVRAARGIVERAESQEPNLLHWGGCGDGESSYGSVNGGKFTTALVDTYNPRLTYREWFNSAIKRMPAYQRPTWGETGVSFGDTLIFK